MRRYLAIPIALATLATFTGCSDSEADPSVAPDESVAATPEATSEEGQPETTMEAEAAQPTAEAKAILTLEDGTVFPMVIDSCEIAGNSDYGDGYVFFIARQVEGADKLFFQISQGATADGPLSLVAGILQTGYVDDDAEANYTFNSDTSTVTTEALMVTGSLTLNFSSSQGDNPMFGDSITGEFSADCA